VNGETITSDLVLSGADYHHTETLLDKNFRLLRKILGQSSFCSFIFIVLCGFDKKIENISHHALFFDVDFISMQKIFMMHHSGQKSLCFTLISLLTDKTAAPEGMESGFSCSAGTWN
jgi:phytoene desaturase